MSNSPDGVVIDAAGGNLEAFVTEIRERRPSSARITSIETETVTLDDRADFVIEPSRAGEKPTALIPPDIAVCDACLDELFDPGNRRYRYPFINCTHCGPRFTLIQGLPYDRPKTTMARFQMCPACQSEYEDPLDRRFHAQPNACTQCGPRLSLSDAAGNRIVSSEPIAESVRRLAAGDILAVKGIGGYHLAVDATNDLAVQRLRSRKHREEKPLGSDGAIAGPGCEFCELDDGEAELLAGPERPIVLLRKRSMASRLIADSVAPGQASLGVMLSYTPFRSLVGHLPRTLEVDPVAVVHDLHPDYLSTRWALAEAGLPAIAVQHHHAHIAAVLAEHRLEGPVVGLSLDGTGFGTDGRIWGGEVLVADLRGFVRAAHLPYVTLLGGEAAVKEPWRMALVWLHRIYGRDLFDLRIPLLASIDRGRARRLLDAYESGFPWPLTSSCGRLFDAVAALTGVKTHARYEGQAAMELEGVAESFLSNEDIETAGHPGGGFPVEAIVTAAVAELGARPAVR